MKLLTVSVAAYNAEGWLARCLKSLTENSVAEDIDVIIVNDGSSDGTLEIARSYEKRYPSIIRVVDKDNGGHGSTINVAIERALGKYFKIVDSDDWVEAGGIERLIRVLAQSDADCIVNPYFRVDADSGAKTLVNVFDRSNPLGTELQVNQIKGDLKLAMHALCFRTDLLKCSPYRLDEKCFYVDAEYIVYYFGDCQTVLLLDWPVYDYLVGTSEQSVNISNMIARREQHKRVCFSCLDYFNSVGNESSKRYRIIERCILGIIGTEYRILLCLPYEEARKELPEFDSQFESSNKSLYARFLEVFGKSNLVGKVIGLLRSRGFKYFAFINALYRLKFLKTCGSR